MISHPTPSSNSGAHLVSFCKARATNSLTPPSFSRQPGQGTEEEIGDRERLKEELRKAEQEYYENKAKEEGKEQQRLIGAGPEATEADARRQKLLEEAERMAELDRDEQNSDSDDSESSSSESR